MTNRAEHQNNDEVLSGSESATQAALDEETVPRTERIATQSGFEIVRAGLFDLQVTQMPAGADDVSGTAKVFTASHIDGHRLDLLAIRAANGESWVEARRIESESPWVRKLDGRLRLTIGRHPEVGSWCELRLAKPKPGGWSNLFGVTLEDLDAAAGVSVERELRRPGETSELAKSCSGIPGVDMQLSTRSSIRRTSASRFSPFS